MRKGLLTALLALAAPVAAQQPASPPAELAPQSTVTVVPAPPTGASFWARAERIRTVDIPHWAKDAGHNGSATYKATVGPDGKLVALELMVSSMSEAIDAAVKTRAETLAYEPATDKDGNPTTGPVIVRMGFALFDKHSPIGGIESYTCGDLVREHGWFTAANAVRELPFMPQMIFVSLGSVMRVGRGEPIDDAGMDADIAARKALWQALLERCRASPERLLLDEVDHPEAYRDQMLRH